LQALLKKINKYKKKYKKNGVTVEACLLKGKARIYTYIFQNKNKREFLENKKNPGQTTMARSW
jgi:hypothetical protein